MKTRKYQPGAIKIIQIIIEIFSLQINFLFAASPTGIDHGTNFSICVICSNGAAETQKDILFNELISLAPSTPAEATFSDEAAYAEINLAPTTPEEASFDDDPELIRPPVAEGLAPSTPSEADFSN